MYRGTRAEVVRSRCAGTEHTTGRTTRGRNYVTTTTPETTREITTIGHRPTRRTGETRETGRRRRLRTRLLLPVAALAVALAATACLPPASTATADSGGVESMINSSRADNGLPALADDAQLDALAQNWATQLAAAGHLAHQDLYAIITSPLMAGWGRLTENVFMGTGGSTNALVDNLWMASSSHRANILDPGVNRVGVGVAHDGSGNTYVVADFGLR